MQKEQDMPEMLEAREKKKTKKKIKEIVKDER